MPNYEPTKRVYIAVPETLWEVLERDAVTCHRNPRQQLEVRVIGVLSDIQADQQEYDQQKEHLAQEPGHSTNFIGGPPDQSLLD